MKHLPKLPGKPEALCGGKMPATTMHISECECRLCLWAMLMQLRPLEAQCVARLFEMEAVNGKKRE